MPCFGFALASLALIFIAPHQKEEHPYIMHLVCIFHLPSMMNYEIRGGRGLRARVGDMHIRAFNKK
jgi:hypothetical protein